VKRIAAWHAEYAWRACQRQGLCELRLPVTMAAALLRMANTRQIVLAKLIVRMARSCALGALSGREQNNNLAPLRAARENQLKLQIDKLKQCHKRIGVSTERVKALVQTHARSQKGEGAY
jgi:hypothetical protein